MEKIISHGDVEITVRTALGYDELDRDLIIMKLGDPADLRARYQAGTFADMVTQTVEAKGLPFAMPTVTDDAETLKAAMKVIFNQPARLIREWIKALDEVNAAPGGDPSLQQEKPADPNTSGGGDSSSST